jgi:hypothetical protein
MEASKELLIDNSCCAGYKEFTFFAANFPFEVNVYNSTVHNYIHAEVTAIGLQEFSLEFPSLVGKVLNGKSVQIIPTTFFHNEVIPIYNGDNTLNFSWAEVGPITGVFTIRIWTDQVELI